MEVNFKCWLERSTLAKSSYWKTTTFHVSILSFSVLILNTIKDKYAEVYYNFPQGKLMCRYCLNVLLTSLAL